APPAARSTYPRRLSAPLRAVRRGRRRGGRTRRQRAVDQPRLEVWTSPGAVFGLGRLPASRCPGRTAARRAARRTRSALRVRAHRGGADAAAEDAAGEPGRAAGVAGGPRLLLSARARAVVAVVPAARPAGRNAGRGRSGRGPALQTAAADPAARAVARRHRPG